VPQVTDLNRSTGTSTNGKVVQLVAQQVAKLSVGDGPPANLDSLSVGGLHQPIDRPRPLTAISTLGQFLTTAKFVKNSRSVIDGRNVLTKHRHDFKVRVLNEIILSPRGRLVCHRK
jgi:hypothetical protein